MFPFSHGKSPNVSPAEGAFSDSNSVKSKTEKGLNISERQKQKKS
jgi:hypothetical protein